MLVKANDVIGLKVITVQKGKQVDDIDDILYDPKTQHVQALVVKSKGLFSDGKVIPIDQVKNIGPDAVIIESDQALKPTKELDANVKHLAESDDYLTKSKVMTESGTDLGKVTDLLFDPATGQVEELEVSQGDLRNIQSGKKRVKPDNIVTVGEDALIVKSYTEDEFAQQAKTGGLTGAVNQAKAKAADTKDTAVDKTQQTVQQAKDAAQSPETQDKLHQARINAMAAGATAQDIIQDTATQAHDKFQQAKQDPVNQAKMDDLTNKLTKAAATAKIKFDQAKESVQQAAEDKKQQVQQAAADQQQQAEQTREQTAVGQYLTQNLIGPNDVILAQRGHIVTHQLIEVAKDQGLLDTLLTNLSKQPVEDI